MIRRFILSGAGPFLPLKNTLTPSVRSTGCLSLSHQTPLPASSAGERCIITGDMRTRYAALDGALAGDPKNAVPCTSARASLAALERLRRSGRIIRAPAGVHSRMMPMPGTSRGAFSRNSGTSRMRLSAFDHVIHIDPGHFDAQFQKARSLDETRTVQRGHRKLFRGPYHPAFGCKDTLLQRCGTCPERAL